MKIPTLKMYAAYLILAVACTLVIVPIQALEVESFADGACWISDESNNTSETFSQNNSLIKFVSFNDNISTIFNKDELVYLALDIEESKRNYKKISSAQLNFHCGSYGHSVIVIDQLSDQCVWMYFKEGNWHVRSRAIIGPHESSSRFCHGLKPGVLLVNVNVASDKESVKTELLKTYTEEIESISDVSSRVVKVNLKKNFIGQEKVIREKFLNNNFFGPRLKIEFNWLSHPVGEFKE